MEFDNHLNMPASFLNESIETELSMQNILAMDFWYLIVEYYVYTKFLYSKSKSFLDPVILKMSFKNANIMPNCQAY